MYYLRLFGEIERERENNALGGKVGRGERGGSPAKYDRNERDGTGREERNILRTT